MLVPRENREPDYLMRFGTANAILSATQDDVRNNESETIEGPPNRSQDSNTGIQDMVSHHPDWETVSDRDVARESKVPSHHAVTNERLITNLANQFFTTKQPAFTGGFFCVPNLDRVAILTASQSGNTTHQDIVVHIGHPLVIRDHHHRVTYLA